MTTFSAGNKVYASDLNDLANKPEARLRQTSAQSINHGTWTALTFGAEDVDTHNGHSTSSNTSRYTAQVAGWYHVTGNGGFVSNSTGHRGVRLHKNGSVVNNTATYFNTSTSDVWSASISADIHLAVNDYVEIAVIQDSGAALNSSGASGDVAPAMNITLINAD